MVLGDEQVSGAVVVEVSGDDGARIFELNFVEADFGGNVFESIRAKVAEQAHFAFTVFRFANGDEVNPTVVVIVDGSDSPAAHPIYGGQGNRLEALALLIAPKRNRSRPGMGKNYIHPAIMIEI